MALPENPITRKETYLAKIAGQEVSIPNVPITREEAYLDEIAKNGGGGGGYVLPTATADRLGGVKIGSGINVEEDGTISANGGGGTSDYPNLTNKPQINSVELSGNKTAEQLGLMGSLEAGNYIDITAGVISVTKEKGEYSLERYVLQSTGGGAPKLVVKKYIDSELISTNEYANNTAHVNIDDTLEIWYSYNPYNWHYKLLVDGVDHSAGYEYEFSYTDTTEYPVDFHIAAGDSTDLVTKSDLTADNIMMSDGVTSVEDALDELKANITSGSTALSFGTEYIASSDGYVRGIVNQGEGKYVQIMLYFSSAGAYGVVAKVADSRNENQICSLYVRKGMKYKIQCSSTNDATCSFIPLS